MKEAKKHIQNWKDIRIAVIPKLGEIAQSPKSIKTAKINTGKLYMEKYPCYNKR